MLALSYLILSTYFLSFSEHIYILQWKERFHILASNMKLFHGKCTWPHLRLLSPQEEMNSLRKSSRPTHIGHHSFPAKNRYRNKYTSSSSQSFLFFNHLTCVEHWDTYFIYVISKLHNNSTKGAPFPLFYRGKKLRFKEVMYLIQLISSWAKILTQIVIPKFMLTQFPWRPSAISLALINFSLLVYFLHASQTWSLLY